MATRSSVIELRFSVDAAGDDEARKFIAANLHRPDRNAWLALYAGDRLPQTVRVLTGIVQNVQAQALERRADLEDARTARAAGALSESDWVDVQSEYQDWKARVSWFRNAGQERLREAKALLKQHNIHQSSLKNASEELAFRDLLARLVEAIRTHQAQTEAVREVLPSDRLLWARLELLRLPSGEPLHELIKRRKCA